MEDFNTKATVAIKNGIVISVVRSVLEIFQAVGRLSSALLTDYHTAVIGLNNAAYFTVASRSSLPPLTHAVYAPSAII